MRSAGDEEGHRWMSAGEEESEVRAGAAVASNKERNDEERSNEERRDKERSEEELGDARDATGPRPLPGRINVVLRDGATCACFE